MNRTSEETLELIAQMPLHELYFKKKLNEFALGFFEYVRDANPEELDEQVLQALRENPRYPIIRIRETREDLKKINSEIKFRENNKDKEVLPPRVVIQAKVGKLTRKKP